MAKMKDNELSAILQEVQSQLDDVLAGERDKLAKASPGEVTSPEVPADASATSPKDKGDDKDGDKGSPEASPEGTPPAEETPGEASPGAAPTGGEDPAAGAAADAGAGDAGGAEGGEFETDPQVLQGEYAKLPPEVLKAHYLACKAALWSTVGADDGSAGAPAPDAGAPAPGLDAGAGAPPPAAPAPDAGAPGAGAPPPPAASPSPELPPAQKAELKINAEANGGKVIKSEREAQLEAELAKTQELTKSLVALTTKLVSRPQRKAVTALSELGKSEATKPATVDPSTLSRPEIIARLNEKARGELKKSDRELITSFCVGSVDASKIAHLLG